MNKNSVNIYSSAIGYAGGNAAAEIVTSMAYAMVRLPEIVFNVLAVWQKRTQDRAHLKSMSDHLLADIGLSRHEVVAEISKPFWRS